VNKAMLRRLDKLTVAEPLDDDSYKRSKWGSWIDEDKDGQNTRAEVLIREHRPHPDHPLTFRTDSDRIVHSGRWLGPYSGDFLYLASDLDVDHLVPLKEAHRSGGHAWTRDMRKRYANGFGKLRWKRGHLKAVDDGLNRQKGAKTPDLWKPPRLRYHFFYARNWIETKRYWNLTVTEAERDALKEMLFVNPRLYDNDNNLIENAG